ncbi:hypothetical protein HPG69_007325, partial [Diceros bicornis minor]
MEAGLLSAVLGLVMVQVETAGQDLDLQKPLSQALTTTGPWRPVLKDRQQQRLVLLGDWLCRSCRQAWIAGFWREVGVASNQNLALKTPKGLEAWFLSLSGAALTVTAAHNSSGSCETEKIVGLGIDISGKFVFPGHREIRVVDTDYKRYAILRVSLLWQDKDFHVLKYFTRSLEDEFEPGFWRFREMTADTGLYLVARHGEPQAFGVGAGLGGDGGVPGAHLRHLTLSLSRREVCQAPEG